MSDTIHLHSAARPLWFGNTRVVIRVSARHGADAISVIEHRMPFGEAPPVHIHHDEDEVFHVLEGSLRVQIAGEERLLRAGETALAPKGQPHGFRVESLAGATVLTICHGLGFETLVLQLARPATGPGLPEPVRMDLEAASAFATMCAANGITLTGSRLH